MNLKHECITKDGQERAALYALGALSQFEARAFDLHLREGCPTCDFELNQFNEVVGILATSVEPVTPPTYLRDLLALRIQREASEAAPTETAVKPFPARSVAAATVVRTPSRAASQWLPWAVAAAFLLAFIASYVAWRTDRTSLQAEIEREKQSSTSIISENANLKERLAATTNEAAQINSVLSQAAWQIIPLKGQEPAPTASATVYWDVQGNRWVITADLPPAPEGKVYQLWFVTSQAKVSAGLIHPDQTGHGFAVLPFPADLGPLAAAAITLEPEGGSEQPTMPIYVIGTA